MPGFGTTDIANSVAVKLGLPLISNVDTPEASENLEFTRRFNNMFEKSRDKLLREHPWNFAQKRTNIADSDGTPAFGFDNQYPLPTDYLRLIAIGSDSTNIFVGMPVPSIPSSLPYRVESGVDGALSVLTDEGPPLFVLYGATVEDPTRFDPSFVDALAAWMAYQMSSMSVSTTKQELLQDYLLAIREAKKADGMDDGPLAIPEDDWIKVRL